MQFVKISIIAVVIAVVAYFVWPTSNPTEDQAMPVAPQGQALVNVVVPQSMSPNAVLGKKGYDAKCAVCHAENGQGQKGVAPPLVHKIYEPNHHADEAFQRAAALGVKSHHWPFGDMPPVDGITRGDVKMIVAYIRELQRANGIN